MALDFQPGARLDPPVELLPGLAPEHDHGTRAPLQRPAAADRGARRGRDGGQRLGRARVAGRIAELNGRFRELAAMKHVTLHTPLAPELAAGIVCFEVKGLTPHQVVERWCPPTRS